MNTARTDDHMPPWQTIIRMSFPVSGVGMVCVDRRAQQSHP